VLLSLYVLLLLATASVSQQNLRRATLQELRFELERKASTLSYFFVERMADMEALHEDRSLEVFFANRALGMSMTYGLAANLYTVRKRFEGLVAVKRMGEIPVYRRLLFLDEQGRPLVDVGPAAGGDLGWIDASRALPPHPALALYEADGVRCFALMTPHFFKGRAIGRIIAELNLQAVLARLVELPMDEQHSAPVVEVRIDPSPAYPSQVLLQMGTPSLDEVPPFEPLSAPVAGTPFILHVAHPGAVLRGYLTSPWLLFSFGLLGMALLGAIMLAMRAWGHKLAMDARLYASQRQRALLREQNERLEEEIHKRLAFEQQLAHQAHYDGLTRLPNRMLAMERLGHALSGLDRQNGAVVVMFIDLDRFKNINDTLGHDAGDALLREAAQRLTRSIRSNDTAARLGGDEFFILMTGVADDSAAELVCEKVLANFAHPFDLLGQEVYCSASIGVALAPRDGHDATTLMKHADLALYRAKESGRDAFCFFTASMQQHAQARHLMEQLLKLALERHELSLRYQPQFELDTLQMTGVEVLVRWENPQLGEVEPDVFIPLAEEAGLMDAIGDWVLGQAFADISHLGPLGHPLSFSINISARQLRHGKHLLERLDQLLQESGLPAERLELEISERVRLGEIPEVGALIDALDRRGVRLVLDDFGISLLALAYIRQFPVRGLKIDHLFVQNIARNEDDARLAKAIIALAQTLDIRVVAEGVESQAQAGLLYDFGCHLAQGYYFAEPMPIRDLAAWLAEGDSAVSVEFGDLNDLGDEPPKP